jgi:predicted transcriptional regulator
LIIFDQFVNAACDMIEPVQLRMGRAALDWSAKELGKKAAVGHATVSRFEAGSDVTVSTLKSLQSALEKGGVIFIPRDANGGPGVRLKK